MQKPTSTHNLAQKSWTCTVVECCVYTEFVGWRSKGGSLCAYYYIDLIVCQFKGEPHLQHIVYTFFFHSFKIFHNISVNFLKLLLCFCNAEQSHFIARPLTPHISSFGVSQFPLLWLHQGTKIMHNSLFSWWTQNQIKSPEFLQLWRVHCFFPSLVLKWQATYGKVAVLVIKSSSFLPVLCQLNNIVGSVRLRHVLYHSVHPLPP